MNQQRKYFRHSIIQLEVIFEELSGDIAALEELEEELKHRKTQRSRKLLAKVKEELGICASDHSNYTKHGNAADEPTFESELSAQPQKTSTTESISELVESEYVRRGADLIVNEECINWDEEFSNLPKVSQPSEEVRNDNLEGDAIDILEAWMTIESFTPQTYKKPQDLKGGGSVAFLKEGEPWFKNEKSRPRCNLYYVVYIGAIKLDPASEKLLQIYQDERVERPNQVGSAALGAILVNKHGVPVPETGIALSSFGWAYGQALSGNLEQVKHWESAEEILCEKMESLVYLKDENDQDIPLSIQQLNKVFNWYVKVCNIPANDVVEPTFAIRLYQPFSKGEPETPLLNSFFLSDLQWAASMVRDRSENAALSRYLSKEPPQHPVDLLHDKSQLEYILEPKYTPLARWPSRGRFPLVLLQQTAVNLTNRVLKQQGLFSVNGPPGTGKTTLLRDVVANNVLARAVELFKFENIDDAFEHSGQIKMGKGFVHLYKLADSIRGHEMLVASSNNKAVENISQELPLASQVADDVSGFNYFKTISDALTEEQEGTWGIVAAVLGNAKNRSNYIDKAWWDDNTGLKTYFGAITGQVSRDPDDYEDGKVPEVIDGCDAPQNQEQAQQRWVKARTEFKSAYQRSHQANELAQKALEAIRFLAKFIKQKEMLESELLKQKETFQSYMTEVGQIQKELSDAQSLSVTNKNKIDHHQSLKLGFFMRLFFRRRWLEWNVELRELNTIFKNSEQREKQLGSELSVVNTRLQQSEDMVLSLQSKLSNLNQQREDAITDIDNAKEICGDKLVTTDLWAHSHEEQQVFAPNFIDAAHRWRDDLFVQSIKLHKAFIDVAAKQIRQNLSAFFFVLSNGKLPEGKKGMLAHLWSTAFILTPVISTTFASVSRMLKGLPIDSLGWLLIDEAGQAVPQAAVGAMLRSKRVVAVGDPLQIEPVVTLPMTLIEGICKHHKVDPYNWGAPYASVQVVSDRANKFGASIPRDMGEIRIGSPLLVHRRCENPMFKISNQIAYNRQMVFATQVKESSLTEVLGDSQWFDVQGSAQEKWCPEEGDYVAEMVLSCAEKLGEKLDLFIISPFKIVEINMRKRMLRETQKLQEFGISDPESWIYEHIGTVHTFQGREAQGVILILGAPSISQDGARAWATSNVNLLNVAVSRAKQNFYVVGNYQLWSQIGNMKVVSRNLLNGK